MNRASAGRSDFARPRAPSSAPPIGKSRLRLDPRTQLLYSGATFFINGETLVLPRHKARAMRALADGRRIAGRVLARAGLTALAREWYRNGYLVLEEPW